MSLLLASLIVDMQRSSMSKPIRANVCKWPENAQSVRNPSGTSAKMEHCRTWSVGDVNEPVG